MNEYHDLFRRRITTGAKNHYNNFEFGQNFYHFQTEVTDSEDTDLWLKIGEHRNCASD